MLRRIFTERSPGAARYALIAVAVALLTACGGGDSSSDDDDVSLDGLVSVNGLSQNHVDGTVNYAQSPPLGGDHNPVWQNCGFYDEPIASENGVHSLEHGAVWITYSLDLPKDQVSSIKNKANDKTFILASPYPGLTSPVVISAWGRQLALDSADDPRLDKFIEAFRQGPQTPEPGAVCTGGTGSPQ